MPAYQRLGDLSWVLSADADPPSTFATLHCETTVPASLEQTFAFFSDAANLERLTPPWLNFAITTPAPVVLRPGAEIDYRISIYGLPVPWRSRIDVWEPNHRFVDRQLVGPYRWWRHEHRFESVPGGTRVIDQVDYVPRAGWFSGAFVRRDLERIFTYRQNALRDMFTAQE
jgi:ligand-binding SRPBCC domain-containing protein